ncbi:helix-turn-helix domain-containing protein [Phaeobacter gallaeciensis]|uniref:helix-turn-helix domain-containing protein n=2 Tax=Phaeobacter gallaeciensis TaxID=60890 RepID=UPI00237F4BF1|nr:helix-turn-helix domain-containing protein [Phaeobacter gallaeciensis]MDE4305868.1 helix-turn-helix domain-containing protein [Phaeobacter gallaeciensis]MDE4310151.1 helix-turn-helix domain-containing protein [Phaeobacter gallaeciensis]MDE4314759.1 helix-turn-helix domain-containing protein [Phaeobacter gallaeciensis]MDE4323522.1 helix-turn-helix domain-containing protein [Phaeobacter gallaeciensis]MDE4328027.1 helix-turn-helix domain-containing protein [Phaeobacter gallaeciensis]
MKTQASALTDDFDDPLITIEEDEEAHEDDLWFLPGPLEEEPDDLPPGPRAEPPDTAVIEGWAKAESVHAARLARVAGRLGALDDRLLRGPEGWRHRLALIEAANLSWLAGDRVSSDRLALWISMRLSGAQDDPNALARVGWAVRRLTGGPGPKADLAAFLDRRDPENIEDSAERFEDRAGGWLDVMAAAAELHPITRACMGFHLWSLAGLGQHGDQIEAAVTASRIAACDGSGAVFAPLAMGGAGGLRVSGLPSERLARWLDGMNSAILTAMRTLDDIEAWTGRAENVMAQLSGRTPLALRRTFSQWPLVSAPMAEATTGASRAAVQRNMAWMEASGLIREVTGQGRYRMWSLDI